MQVGSGTGLIVTVPSRFEVVAWRAGNAGSRPADVQLQALRGTRRPELRAPAPSFRPSVADGGRR